MKPIGSMINQYVGINAHLHSYWQAKGGWKEFHNSYIIDTERLLKKQLLPMGYMAATESSLQIRQLGKLDSMPESDITIYDPDPARPYRQRQPVMAGAPAAVLDLLDVLEIEEEPSEYRAIAIYEAQPGGRRSEPVAWIEVLSPSNKPGGANSYEYRRKRHKLLDSAIAFVEIDYLHESRPTFRNVPVYQSRSKNGKIEADAHPYRIMVIDPRPMISQGTAHLYQFDVDTAIPLITIPLNGNDKIVFDFDIPYQRTIREELFGYEFVDYRQLPLNFERYTQADQTRIARRMLAVLNAAQGGLDLETGPFPVQSLPLEEAFVQINTRQTD